MMNTAQKREFTSKYFLVYTIFCCIVAISSLRKLINIMIASQTDAFVISSYMIDYSHGFLPRALIGTSASLLHSMFPAINLSYCAASILSIFCVINFCILVYAGYVAIRKYYVKDVLDFCLLAFCIVYVSRFYLSVHICDSLGATLVLLSLFAINKERYYLVLLFNIIGMLGHEGYLLQFYPIVFSIYMYKLLMDKSKKTVIAVSVNTIVMGLLFLYFMFVHPYADKESMILTDVISKLPSDISEFDINVVKLLVAQEVTGAQFAGATKPVFFSFVMRCIVSVVYIPFSILFIVQAGKFIYKCNDKLNKCVMILMVASLFIPFAVLMLFKTDLSRWAAAFWLHIFIILYLCYRDNEQSIIDIVRGFLKKIFSNVGLTVIFVMAIMIAAPFGVCFEDSMLNLNICGALMNTMESMNWISYDANNNLILNDVLHSILYKLYSLIV